MTIGAVRTTQAAGSTMLFNSYEFLFVFLPLVLAGFVLINRLGRLQLTFGFLTLCSLVYYGWWNPKYLLLIGFSVFFNFAAGQFLATDRKKTLRKPGMILAIIVNIGLLGYFKYTNFFLDSLNHLSGFEIQFHRIVLPIGISFFTFQQVAYIVDSYRHNVVNSTFTEYALFVCFFPQLIAGPIVHHGEILPQFREMQGYRANVKDMSVGLTFLIFGLFKKVVIADNIATFANVSYATVEYGVQPSFFDAWAGSLAFYFQIYFDFSGYTDMAIGMARMFGVRLPENFNSPHKSVSISDFWQRWHITLTRFFRVYVYYPLANRSQAMPRLMWALFVTFLLTGLWHGANWTFVVWGGLHGAMLVTHVVWRRVLRSRGKRELSSGKWWLACAWAITQFMILVTIPYFRAQSIGGATEMATTMLGLHGFDLASAFSRVDFALWMVALFTFVLLLPNSQEVMRDYEPNVVNRTIRKPTRIMQWLTWKPRLQWSFLVAILFVFSTVYLASVEEFVYFQF